MPEKIIELRPIERIYICDNCDNGEMVAIRGDRLKMRDGKIMHFCSSCNHVQGFDIVYPKGEYLPK